MHKTTLQTPTVVRDPYLPRGGQPLQAYLLWKVSAFPCESTKWNKWHGIKNVNQQLLITRKGENQRQIKVKVAAEKKAMEKATDKVKVTAKDGGETSPTPTKVGGEAIARKTKAT